MDNPTPVQDIAMRLVFQFMGERRENRTYEEYMDIARRLPPLKQLHYHVNVLLQSEHDSGWPLPEICRFKAGDKIIRFEPYPRTISYETLRAALVNYGMRKPRWAAAA